MHSALDRVVFHFSRTNICDLRSDILTPPTSRFKYNRDVITSFGNHAPIAFKNTPNKISFVLSTIYQFSCPSPRYYRLGHSLENRLLTLLRVHHGNPHACRTTQLPRLQCKIYPTITPLRCLRPRDHEHPQTSSFHAPRPKRNITLLERVTFPFQPFNLRSGSLFVTSSHTMMPIYYYAQDILTAVYCPAYDNII